MHLSEMVWYGMVFTVWDVLLLPGQTDIQTHINFRQTQNSSSFTVEDYGTKTRSCLNIYVYQLSCKY